MLSVAAILRPAVLALTATSAVAGQGPTFSARVDVVRVDVLVTEQGRVVQGLKPQDFEVRDNGVVQQVDFVNLEQLPLDVVLALDVSASVSGERLEHLQAAGYSLLQRLAPRDRAALVTFSHVVRLERRLTGDLSRVRAALGAVLPAGDTALIDGSYAAMASTESGGSRVFLTTSGPAVVK